MLVVGGFQESYQSTFPKICTDSEQHVAVICPHHEYSYNFMRVRYIKTISIKTTQIYPQGHCYYIPLQIMWIDELHPLPCLAPVWIEQLPMTKEEIGHIEQLVKE